MTVNKRLNAEELEAIRKRAEAATPGPWGYADRDNVVFTANADYKYAVEIAEEVGHKFDGEFIAHAREDVPKLLAEIARLNSQLSELIGAIYEYEPEGTALWDLAEAMDNDED
jgi:hypothetical protein